MCLLHFLICQRQYMIIYFIDENRTFLYWGYNDNFAYWMKCEEIFTVLLLFARYGIWIMLHLSLFNFKTFWLILIRKHTCTNFNFSCYDEVLILQKTASQLHIKEREWLARLFPSPLLYYY